MTDTGAAESRKTHSPPITTRPTVLRSPAQRSPISLTAMRHIAGQLTRKVVSGGVLPAVGQKSSKPTTEMSSGTR